MPVSARHIHAARRAARQAPAAKLYRITDVHHRPDLRGEFAGVKVQRVGHHQLVSLTDDQARFYLDQGALELVVPVEDKQDKQPAKGKFA
jgi:hypothetical protein